MNDYTDGPETALDALDESSSMVPLIDVLFAVLASLMFALTAAQFDGSIDVDLPRVEAPSREAQETYEIVVLPDGQAMFNGGEIAIDDLTETIDAALVRETRPLVLRADRTATFEDGARALKAIQRSSARSASIATER